MFAITSDLTVAKTKKYHPKGLTQAYADIARELRSMGFERVQGSVYLTQRNDLANLFNAIRALEAMPWFPHCVRDVRGFRVEEWSDFTPSMKASAAKTSAAEIHRDAAGKKKGKRSGFDEEPSPYIAGLQSDLPGQVRRLGEAGPAYEVVELVDEDEALVEVVYSGERVTLAVRDILTDPIAETIP